jgi:glycosyltransferase involved in cell wall biosynthesis
MKILFLVSQLPYPPDTGAKIRVYNLLKRLSSRHDITVFTFGDEKEEKFKIEAVGKFCARMVVMPRNGRSKYVELFMNLCSGLPYNIQKRYSKDMVEMIRTSIGQGDYDLIHCDSLQASVNVLSVMGIPKILTEHNIEAFIMQRYAESTANPIKRLAIYGQYRKLVNYEFSACGKFDRVVAVSEEDARVIRAQVTGLKSQVAIVPNGVDTEYFKPSTKDDGREVSLRGARPLKLDATTQSPYGEASHSKNEIASPAYGGLAMTRVAKLARNDESQYAIRNTNHPPSLAFTGSMDWLPNVDAVEYFCKDILPLIWKVKEDARFYIVGRNPAKNIIELGKRDTRIVVTGSVEDVRPYLEKAKAFVVPLRIGGGTRLKILEAMAMECPVVSTSIGAEGIEVTPGEDILIADEPAAFADRVIALFDCGELRERIGQAGRSLVENKYDWDIIAEKLDEVWRETAGMSREMKDASLRGARSLKVRATISAPAIKQPGAIPSPQGRGEQSPYGEASHSKSEIASPLRGSQ